MTPRRPAGLLASLVLALIFPLSSARQIVLEAHRPTVREQLDDASLEQLARTFSPIVYLAENEVYLPSSLDYFLPALRPLTASQEPIPHPLPLTPSNLSPEGWSYDQHLAVQYPPVEEDEGNPYNAQPDLADGVDPRVFGQGGEDVEGRWEAKAVVVEKTDGVVDIYYWTYWPFNRGKLVGPLGIVGNHLSDWEGMMVRTIYGEPISVDYLSHESPFGYGTMRWQDAPKEDGRPVAFSAWGSHGLWPTPGEHTYARALSFSLIDSTSYGIRWPLDNIQILPYFAPYQGRSRRHRRRFEGDQTWANFLGRWGDNGSRKCWWWGVWKECGLVDGPRGPLRDSETWPPTCIIAKVPSLALEDLKSTYSFTLTPHLLGPDSPFLALRQTCRPLAFAPTLPDFVPDEEKRSKQPDDPSEETSWTWVDAGDWAEGEKGEKRGTVEVEGCRKGFYASSYSVALAPEIPSFAPPKPKPTCETCTFQGPPRLLCAYADEFEGKVWSGAVEVGDVDWWGWPAA